MSLQSITTATLGAISSVASRALSLASLGLLGGASQPEPQNPQGGGMPQMIRPRGWFRRPRGMTPTTLDIAMASIGAGQTR